MEASYKDKCHQAIEPYISGVATTCSYCDRLEPLILLEGEHAYITLAIGQIVEGYLQVCARHHRTSATGFFPHERDELNLLKDIVRETYKEVYGNYGIAFEHGQAGTCLFKEDNKTSHSLCHHAHIHFVPVNIDIREEIKKITPYEIAIDKYDQLIEIRKYELDGGPYLYFEDSNRIGYVYPVDDESIIPRQFLRTCVAEKLEMKNRADWMKYPGTEYFESGRDKLQKVLHNIYSAKRKSRN